MRIQPFLIEIDVKQSGRHQIIILLSRIILNNDILKFREFLIYLFMMFGKSCNLIALAERALQQ